MVLFFLEKYLYAYHKIYGLNTISLRYLNIYGPRQDISPYSGVISKWLGRLKQNKNLVIYGDGEQTRDFIYIKDLTEAYFQAIYFNSDKLEIINLGFGESYSIKNITDQIKSLFPGKLEVQFSNKTRVNEVNDTVADISKAKKLLNWQPEYSLSDGIKDYLNMDSTDGLYK